MSLNLIVQDLKSNVKIFMVASLVIIVFIAGVMGMYAGMKDNMSVLLDTGFYSSVPEALAEALYFHTNQWASVLGFYVTYFLYFVPIVAAIYCFILGNSILAGEEQNKTTEYLLSMPLSRQQIIFSKLIVLIIYSAGINVIAFITGLISCGLASSWDFKMGSLGILHTYGFLYCLSFGCSGFFMAVKMKRAKKLTGFGMGIVLILYFVNTIIRIIKRAQFILYFTPLHYVDLKVISEDYGFETWRLAGFAGIIGVLILFSYLLYRKKNILI